jgi:hypothetical protein
MILEQQCHSRKDGSNIVDDCRLGVGPHSAGVELLGWKIVGHCVDALQE